MKKLVLLLLCCALVSAAHVTVWNPVQDALEDGGSLNLGVIGPGQKVEIVIDRGSGEENPSGGEALWDRTIIEEATLPVGWTKEDGKFYESPMHAYVSAAKNAADGEYEFYLMVIDEYERAPTTRVKCSVVVSRDVFQSSLANNIVVAGVDQPATYYLFLKNDSSASDSFEVTVKGLPGGLLEPRKVFVPYKSERLIAYPVSSSEAGSFALEFNVKSLSSSGMNASLPAALEAERSLYQDMRATSHGVLLFPSLQQVIYALFGLTSNLK